MNKTKKRVLNLLFLIVLLVSCKLSSSDFTSISSGYAQNSNKDSQLLASNVNVSSPPDIAYLAGDPRTYEIIWEITGDSTTSTGIYNITRNGTFYLEGTWNDGEKISVDVSNISTAVYYIFIIYVYVSITTNLNEQLMAEDANDRVDVNVLDCLGWDGEVESQGDLVMTKGTEDNEISWLVTRLSFSKGEVVDVDGDQVFEIDEEIDIEEENINWGYVRYAVDHLMEGGYTFTCKVFYFDCERLYENPDPAIDSIIVTVKGVEETVTETETKKTYGGISVFIYLTILGSVRFLRKKNKK